MTQGQIYFKIINYFNWNMGDLKIKLQNKLLANVNGHIQTEWLQNIMKWVICWMETFEQLTEYTFVMVS